MDSIWLSSIVTLWVVVLIMAFLLVGVLRQIGLLQLRFGGDPGALITDAGLDRGAYTPDFEAVDVDTGQTRRFSDLPHVARVITFLSPSCLSCKTLIPHLNEVMAVRKHEFDFRIICRGDINACRAFRDTERLRAPMLVDVDGGVERSFQVVHTPFVYVLSHDQRVLIRGIANDWRHLDSLLDQEGTLEAGRLWTTVDGSLRSDEPAHNVLRQGVE